MNNCSLFPPTTVKLSEAEYSVMRKAGLDLDVRPEMSVRLDESHFKAISLIRNRNHVPGMPMSRVGAIRLALHKYCENLSEGRRYDSFTDLVRDALIWVAG